MDYSEVLEEAKKHIGPNCKVCPVCNGIACGNTMPGPGSKAPGLGANDNYNAWRKIRLNMDTITELRPMDTAIEFFGRTLSFPLLTAPVGSTRIHFTPESDVTDFNDQCFAACKSRGILHAYGNGMTDEVFEKTIAASLSHDNTGIPVYNPDSVENIKRLMDLYQGKQMPIAMSIVVDSAGLPHLNSCMGGRGGTKSIEDLKELKEYMKLPMIVKGVMTVKGADEAGADAVIVSNHGGRVLSDTPATAEVLPEIVDAVKGKTKILVDGGIRSGVDLFKALAIGADACLICRPVVIAYYGAGQEGIECYLDKIKAELMDTMYMCGAASIRDISRDMIRLPK